MALSSITNGRLHLRLKDGGVDGRSRGARRFKDLVKAYGAEYGGYERLGEIDKARIRQAATLQLREEQLQEAVVKGEAINPDELIRLTNNVRRCLDGIKGAKPAEKPASGLGGYFAQRGAAA